MGSQQATEEVLDMESPALSDMSGSNTGRPNETVVFFFFDDFGEDDDGGVVEGEGCDDGLVMPVAGETGRLCRRFLRRIFSKLQG